MALPARGRRAGPSATLRHGTAADASAWRPSPAPDPPHERRPTADGGDEHRHGALVRLGLPVLAIAAAIVLVVVGPGTWSRSRVGTGSVAVDVEDVVVRALAVDGAARRLVTRAQAHADLFALPGAAAAGRDVDTATTELQRAVLADVPAAMPSLATAYVRSPEHEALVAQGRALAELAAAAAFLESVHTTLFGGSGQVLAAEAQVRLTGMLSSGTGGPLERWAGTLLAAYDGQPTGADAGAARGEVVATWQARVAALRPGAEDELLALLAAVDAPTLEALRGHPVAGPSLALLLERSAAPVAPAAPVQPGAASPGALAATPIPP